MRHNSSIHIFRLIFEFSVSTAIKCHCVLDYLINTMPAILIYTSTWDDWHSDTILIDLCAGFWLGKLPSSPCLIFAIQHINPYLQAQVLSRNWIRHFRMIQEKIPICGVKITKNSKLSKCSLQGPSDRARRTCSIPYQHATQWYNHRMPILFISR